MNFNQYDSLFFDCDGVILDSNKIKTEAFYQVALEYGKDIAEKFVEYHTTNGGVSRFEKCRYLITTLVGIENDQEKVDAAVSRFAKLVKEKLIESREVGGVRSLLEGLECSNIYVVSGGKEDELRDVFKEKQLDKFFNGIYGSPKTKYEIIDEIKKYQPFGKALFLGDSRLDYEVASYYGMDFIFLHGVSEFKEWKSFFKNKNVIISENFLTIKN